MAQGEWLTYTVFGAGDATYSVEVVRTQSLTLLQHYIAWLLQYVCVAEGSHREQ
jgi:hypothetical protein